MPIPTETWACEYAAGSNKIESKAKYLRKRILANLLAPEPGRLLASTGSNH